MAFALGGEAAWYQPPDDGPECLWCSGSAMVEVAAQAELVARSLTPEDVTRAKAEALAMAALSICGLDYEEEE